MAAQAMPRASTVPAKPTTSVPAAVRARKTVGGTIEPSCGTAPACILLGAAIWGTGTAARKITPVAIPIPVTPRAGAA